MVDSGIIRKLKTNVAKAYYWHGLQVASRPFQVILTAAIFAIVFSIPTITLFVNQWSGWRPEIWHDPMSDSSSPTGVHVDILPQWFSKKINHSETFHIIQVHVGEISGSKSSIHSHAWETASNKLPKLLNEKLPEQLSKAWKQNCIMDEKGRCVIIHPGTFEDVQGIPESIDSMRKWISSFTPRSKTISVEGTPKTFKYSKESVCHNRKWTLSTLSCDALVVSLIMSKSTPPSFRSDLATFLESSLGVDEIGGAEGGTNLYYVSRKFNSTEGILVIISYIVVTLYMGASIYRFGNVKSTSGLMILGLLIVTVSISSGIGVATYFGFVKRFYIFDVLPFLVMVIGFDSFPRITKLVASAPRDVAVRFRIADGMSKAGPKLTKTLFQMEAVVLIGAFSKIPQLREFSIVTCLAMLCNFAFVIIVYTGALSLDMRRLELSDLIEQSAKGEGKGFKKERKREASFISEMVKSIHGTDRFVLNTVLGILCMGAIALIAVLNGTTEHGVEGYVEPSLDADWISLALIDPDVGESTKSPQVQQLLQSAERSNVVKFEPVIFFEVESYPADNSSLFDNIHISFEGVQTIHVVFGFFIFLFVAYFGSIFLRNIRNSLFGVRKDLDSLAPMSLLNVDLGKLVQKEKHLELLTVNEEYKMIVGCSMSGVITVWNMQTHRVLCTLRDTSTSELEETNPFVRKFFSDEVVNVDEEGHDGESSNENSVNILEEDDEYNAVGKEEEVDDDDEEEEEEEEEEDMEGITMAFGRHRNKSGLSVESDDDITLPGSGDETESGDVPWCLTTYRNLIAIGFGNGVVEVWEINARRCHILQPTRSGLSPIQPGITQIVFSHNIMFVACDDGVIEAWIVHFDSPTKPQSPQKVFNPYKRGHRRTLSAESTSSTISAGPGGVVIRHDSWWNLSNAITGTISFKHTFVSKCHTGTIPCLVSCGDAVISGGSDGIIRVLPLLDLSVTEKLAGHTSAITCFSSFSGIATSGGTEDVALADTVLVSGSEGGDVCVWDMNHKELEAHFVADEGAISHVAVNSDSVISLSEEYSLRFWSRMTRQCLRTIRSQQPLHSLVLHSSSILVTVSNDELTAWDALAKGERIRKLPLNDHVSPEGVVLQDAHVSLLVDDTIVCTVGSAVFVVELPFPSLRNRKNQ